MSDQRSSLVRDPGPTSGTPQAVSLDLVLGGDVVEFDEIVGRELGCSRRRGSSRSVEPAGPGDRHDVRALLELAYGQVLRRAGQRRAASESLQAARDRLVTLRARPYLERCERELTACGLTPGKRSAFDPSRLTAQELAVARLVAAGMSYRQVASDLFVSVKTVQFHLTHIYAKLGVGSRVELATQSRDSEEIAGSATAPTESTP